MKINVKHIAELANIPITESEETTLEKSLEATLEYVARLSDIDTSKVAGTNEVTHLKNAWREDEVKPSFTQAEALMNARQVHNGLFVVPVIIEEAIE